MTTPPPSWECRLLRANGTACGAETYGAAMCRHHGTSRCEVCQQPATHADTDGNYYCKDHHGKKSDAQQHVPTA